MKERRAPFRLPTAFAAVVSTMAAISLVSGASTETDEEVFARIAERLPQIDQPTGMLTVIRGNVTVNELRATTGLTIISNSRIGTSSGGRAVIELGALGRIHIGDDTKVLLTLLPSMLFVKSECDRTQIIVTRGMVEVQSPKTESIPAGDRSEYKGSVEAMTNGNTDFVIDCHSRSALRVPIAGAQSLWGLLALIGGEAAIQAEVSPVLSSLPP